MGDTTLPLALGASLPQPRQNLFADIDPQGVIPAAEPSKNIFSDFPQAQTYQPTGLSSALSHAVGGLAPTGAGMAGAGAGAEIGAGIGALGGPLSPVTVPVGGFLGGLGGFFAGSYLAEGVQDWGLKQAPDSWQESLGQAEWQRRTQEQEHPIYSFLGGIAPYAMTMWPGALTTKALGLPENATAFQKIIANPLTSRVFGGAAMGGMELGQEEWSGETPNWAKIGISTGFGLIFNHPTRFGEYLVNLGAGAGRVLTAPLVPRTPVDVPPEGLLNPTEPTVAQAGDLGVIGPGITEATYQGGEERSVASRTVAENAAADEQAAVGPNPIPDLDGIARRLAPETFARNDELIALRDSFRDFIATESNPPDAAFEELDFRRSQLEAAISYANPRSPEAANFRAQIAALERERTDLLLRREAWETGTHVDTLDIMLARQHLLDTEHALWDLAPEISAARRRAEDYSGQEEPSAPSEPEHQPIPTSEIEAELPHPAAPSVEAEQPHPAAQPAKTEAEQQDFIIKDRAAQLMAIGLSQGVAEASAHIEAAYYITLAARFGGALGNAEDLYRQRAAQLVGPEGAAHETPVPESGPTSPPRIRTVAEIQSADGVGARAAKRIQDSEIEARGRPIEAARPTLPETPVAPTPEVAEPPQAVSRPRIRTAAQIMTEDHVTANHAQEIQTREIEALAAWQAAHPSTEPRPRRNRATAQISPLGDEGQNSLLQRASRSVQGRIRISPGDARSIIMLARTADASTFMHESAHDWLKQLLQDALHALAPTQLRADAATVRAWLKRPEGWTGFKPDGSPDVAPQERFARAFEQYLREGHAPSRSLDRVFAQFKAWLRTIYRTLRGLGAPISDDIRQVFDRMLATEPEHRTHGEVQERQPSLATIHETDAKETEPHEAEAVGDRVVSERDRIVSSQPPEVASELGAAAQGTAKPVGEIRPSAGGLPAVEGGSGESEPVASSSQGRAGGGNIERGSGQTLPEGSRPSAGTVEGGRRPVSGRAAGAEQLAPSPTENFTESEPRFTDLAGNIRVENLTDQADIAQAIHDSADRNDEFRSVREGPTKGQMMALADAMGLDPSKIDESILARMFGGTKELGKKILAARKLVVQSAGIVSNLMKAAAESGAERDLAALGVAIARHDLIQSALAGVTAEWGRAGNAFHSLLEGWQKAKDINQLLKDNIGRDLYQLSQIAKLGSRMDTPGKVSKLLRDAQERTFGRMVLEYWINGLISGISTHITYSIGNAILAATKAGPETAVAAAIGALRGRQERVRFGEVGAQFRGAFREAPSAAQAMIEAYRSGATTLLPGETARAIIPFQGDTSLVIGRGMTNAPVTWREAGRDAYALVQGMRDGLVSAGQLVMAGGAPGAPLVGLEYAPGRQIPDIMLRGLRLPLGEVLRFPSRNVAAIHSAFRALNYSMEINALAYRQAAGEGLAGAELAARIAYLRQNPTEAMMEQARGTATTLTLMGEAGRFTQALQRLTNIEIGGWPIFKFIDPFVHIAANIMNQSLVHRTPVGLLSREVRADLMGRNGAIAQDTASAKMLFGSSVAVALGGLAAEGLASGSGPADPNKAAMWRLTGNQAHSVRIGDIWHAVNRLGPLGMLMSVSADLYSVAHQIGRDDADVVAKSLMHAFTQNILDESFMRGPSDLIRAVTDPDHYGAGYIRTFLSSFVPFSVGLAQMARASDPYSRQARTIMDAVLAKIPGVSESLLPRRDIWGEPVPSGEALLGSGITAIYARRMSSDPVNVAMLNLGIGPAPVGRSIRNVQLSENQYDEFSRVAGRSTKMRLDMIVRSPDYQNWPNSTRYEVIEEVIRQSREAARGWMMMKYPEIPRQAAKLQIARKTGEPVK